MCLCRSICFCMMISITAYNALLNPSSTFTWHSVYGKNIQHDEIWTFVKLCETSCCPPFFSSFFFADFDAKEMSCFVLFRKVVLQFLTCRKSLQLFLKTQFSQNINEYMSTKTKLSNIHSCVGLFLSEMLSEQNVNLI